MTVIGSAGMILRVHVRWQNTGTISHTFRIFGGFGTWNGLERLPDDTGTGSIYHSPGYWDSRYFTWDGRYTSEIYTADVGEIRESIFDVPTTAEDVGTWSLFGGVTESEGSTSSVESVRTCYDMLIKVGEVEVTHRIGGMILDVWAEFIA